MKKCFSIFSLVLLFIGMSIAQVRLATAYNYPPKDTVLNGLKSIRGVAYAADPFKDGHSAIAATNYNDLGHVHVFINAGNDSLQLVWTSPRLTAGGGASTPRYVMFGDLDNDGLPEIIFQSNNNGILIFEWDGVPGSYNFGTVPSQVIGSDYLTGVSGNCEYMEISDVDGDNENELLVAYNSAPNSSDIYYSISATGDWSTDNPGFSGFNVEYKGVRTDLAKWGLGGGTPYAMIAAKLDGTGKKGIILHNWNLKNVTPITVPSANTYVLADTNTNQQNIFLGGADDDVALFGGMAYDIDKDGREEIYLPTYSSIFSHRPLIHMIHYETGDNTAIIDSAKNVFTLDLGSLYTPDMTNWFNCTYSMGYGDIDGNGKINLYISSGYPLNIISAEFQGGNKTDMNNWIIKSLYAGDISTEQNLYVIKDSLGHIDTTKTAEIANISIAAKIFGQFTDFDKDGLEDIIIPYQSIIDSITVKHLVWNTSTNAFDSTTSKVLNPKRFALRVIEKDNSVGISTKELTMITPEDFSLEQNYPNPFNPETTVRFTLPLKSIVSLKIYDMLGKEVATLLNKQEHDKGAFEMKWDGTNNYGKQVASGNYVAELKFGNFSKSIKMTLIK
ncbi:MAG: FG-GAP-like repeat-containing protein [Ignavibacteriaceae bacterium]|nr:FG-GAP-like repeat-containing protein [Ignavibacteriaceae bacterium]